MTTSVNPDAGLSLFAEGRLADLEPGVRRRLLERDLAEEPSTGAEDAEPRTTERAVAAMIADVRARGDEALRDMGERFDGVRLDALEIPPARWKAALDALDADVRRALERAAANLSTFHRAQMPADVSVEVEPGVRVTRTWSPLRRVGVYAPGGRAAYPSSVLMGVVPARAAGVEEVIVCSPPGASGTPPDAVLAACAIAGADRIFATGGAGAIAALGYGTASIPAVDSIIGPGNRWVTEAKRQVAGRVPIDGPAGPSEVLVLADDAADAELVAHELMAQAEHDPDAACVLVTTSEELAAGVRAVLTRQLEAAFRRDVAAAALAGAGALLVADDLDAAVAFADAYAPEHLSIMTADASRVAARISTAGTIFVGACASVAFGDYLTGANHVLPTGGRARSFSGLSLQHYLRSYTVQEITREGADGLASDVATLAAAEGLPAHRAAALARRTT